MLKIILEFINAERLLLTGWDTFESLWEELNTKYLHGGKSEVEYYQLVSNDANRVKDYFYKQKLSALTSVQLNKQLNRKLQVLYINFKHTGGVFKGF